MNLAAKIATLLLWATAALAESVDVKYRGAVDLKPFACTDTPRSSFIQRVCYDKGQSYMLISLCGTGSPVNVRSARQKPKKNPPG